MAPLAITGRATRSRLSPMRDFTWLLRRYEHDIRACCRLPIDYGTVALPERNQHRTVSAQSDSVRGDGRQV